MIDPTREEWLAARDALVSKVERRPDVIAEAILGPCPPEPVPDLWRIGGFSSPSVQTDVARNRVRVWVSREGNALTPDDADAMAAALIEHAAYAREQEAPPGNRERPRAFAPNPGDEPICGRLLVGQGTDTWDPVCQRPRGHAGLCQEGFDE